MQISGHQAMSAGSFAFSFYSLDFGGPFSELVAA